MTNSSSRFTTPLRLDPCKDLADFSLISIAAGAIDQTIAAMNRALHRRRDRLGVVTVRAKGPQAKARDLAAIGERARRNKFGIYIHRLIFPFSHVLAVSEQDLAVYLLRVLKTGKRFIRPGHGILPVNKGRIKLEMTGGKVMRCKRPFPARERR